MDFSKVVDLQRSNKKSSDFSIERHFFGKSDLFSIKMTDQ